MNSNFNISLLAQHKRDRLGPELPLATFRLLRLYGMQEIFGESTGPALYMVGKSIGQAIESNSLTEFFELVMELKIGIASIMQQTERLIVIKMLECMTCSGLPVTGELFCDFEAGFIAGAIEKIIKGKFNCS